VGVLDVDVDMVVSQRQKSKSDTDELLGGRGEVSTATARFKTGEQTWKRRKKVDVVDCVRNAATPIPFRA
jgi:hypothetical protein